MTLHLHSHCPMMIRIKLVQQTWLSLNNACNRHLLGRSHVGPGHPVSTLPGPFHILPATVLQTLAPVCRDWPTSNNAPTELVGHILKEPLEHPVEVSRWRSHSEKNLEGDRMFASENSGLGMSYSLVFSVWACAMALRRKCVVHSEASQIHPRSGSACGLVRPNRMSSGVAMDRTKDFLKSVASVGSDQCPEMPQNVYDDSMTKYFLHLHSLALHPTCPFS